jgi:hypothetical protein
MFLSLLRPFYPPFLSLPVFANSARERYYCVREFNEKNLPKTLILGKFYLTVFTGLGILALYCLKERGENPRLSRNCDGAQFCHAPGLIRARPLV